MEEYLRKLRTVKKGDYVLADDHNLKRYCLYSARDWMIRICEKFGIDPKYVYELDPYLDKIRTVKSGDIIEPEDHNSIVEALRKLRDVLEKIEEMVYGEGYEKGYEKGYEEGIAYCLEKLVPIKECLVLGVDIVLSEKPDEVMPTEIVLGADTEVSEKLEIGSEVSIEKAS